MAATRRDLFLQVNGDLGNLKTTMAAGRTALLSLGTAAGDVQAEVQKAFAEMGSNAPAQAKVIDKAYADTFAAIRRNAQSVLAAGSGIDAVKIFDAAGAMQAAKAAEDEAAALRIAADAAGVVAARQGDASGAARILAAALETQALDAEIAAKAMRTQASVLSEVSAEAKLATVAQDEVSHSHARMGASGMIAQHVVRSFTDSVAAGQSPIRAATMELGRITEALTFYAQETNATSGVLGKFAAFMRGPWGAALSIAVVLLTPLIGKLLEAKDASKDAQKAEEDYAKSLGDIGSYIDDYNGKLREQLRLKAQLSRGDMVAQVNASAKVVTDYRDQAFEKARAIADPQRHGSVLVQGGISQAVADGADPSMFLNPRVQAAIDAAGGSVVKLATNLKALGKGTPEERGLYAEVASLAAKATEAEAATNKVRGNLRGVDTLLAGGSIDSAARSDRHVAELTATTDLEKAQLRLNAAKARETELDSEPIGPRRTQQRAAADKELLAATQAVKAAQDAAKEARGDGAASNQATDLAYMEAFLKREIPGVRITSTNGGKHVTNSDHYKDRALDFVPPGGMGSMTKDDIRRIFEENGLRIRRNKGGVEQLFGPGDKGHSDHFHVAWEGRAPTDATLDKRQQAGARREANDDRAYQGELGQAQDRLAKARLAFADTAEGRYRVEVEDLRSALVQRGLQLDDEVRAGKISAAQALQLKVITGAAEQLDEVAAKRKEQSALLEDQLQRDHSQIANGIVLLQLQADLATTTKRRRELALRILAQEEADARLQMNKVIADPTSTKSQREAAIAGKAALDEQHPLKVEAINRQTASPMDRYRQQLKSEVGDMNEALQGLEVSAIERLGDGFAGAAAKALHLHGVLGDVVSDLLKMAEKRAIFELIGGGAGGTGILGGILGHADGGHIRGPGTGRSDSILARLSNGEFVINAAATARYLPVLHAINDNRPLPKFADGGLVSADRIFMPSLPSMASLARPGTQVVQQHFHVNAQGAILAADIMHQIGAVGQAAVIGGSQMAQSDLAERQAQALS